MNVSPDWSCITKPLDSVVMMADTVCMAATDITRRLIGIIWQTRTDTEFDAWLTDIADLYTSDQILNRITQEIPEVDLSARTIRRWINQLEES